MDAKLIGARIKQLRTQHNYTHKEMAERTRRYAPSHIKLADSAFSQYEHGKARPQTAVLMAIAQVLETSVEYLIGMTNDSTPTKHGLTPDPEFWALSRELNGQPPRLKRLAAQLIETMLTYAREYAEWASSAPGDDNAGETRAQALEKWAGQSADELTLQSWLQADHHRDATLNDIHGNAAEESRPANDSESDEAAQ